jgi:hypothetical protein
MEIDMDLHDARWGKTIFWGTMTAALYAVMFYHSDLILHLAHTTPEACVVGQGPGATYLHHADAVACAAKGGHLEPANHWNVLLPIVIAFAVSFAHGAFTGLFWEMMGLKPATHAEKK